ncbi:Phospholipid scramblase 1 [Holothuria leucospilota]|uniref:Phospholipid scramblase n=1 Tax=Holothuria leucospilota TaxID=206669 RepID=A0A9Q1CN98_HOLLE|nr:Phospholipid scramblase 1 [Holothuria leucospilota]
MVNKSKNLGMHFPLDMDVKVKATLIGALFLIEFMFFEAKQVENSSEKYGPCKEMKPPVLSTKH